MEKLPSLKVIANGNNPKGDTLTRLVGDLFHTLGYENFRFNIHKSGREVDLTAYHRHENRMLIAECKAQVPPVGGSDINKFAGVLEAERRTNQEVPIAGYYVSLSGFTETAVEQERAIDPPRLIMLDGPGIVKALVEGKIVVSPTQAAETAGRYVHAHKPQLKFMEGLDLLASPLGWLWAVNFGDSSTNTAVCLVHADGEIVNSTALDSLKKLVPLPIILREGLYDSNLEGKFKRKYNDYLSSEYGNITLEGLPTDQQVGSRTFMLEDLYVPLDLVSIGQIREGSGVSAVESQPVAPDDADDNTTRRNARGTVQSIGQVLSKDGRIAILGPPGAGKTTILKRLCMAFSDPARSHASDDDIPNYAAFPLVIRCRQLGALAGRPISEVIDDVMVRAEMHTFAEVFRIYVGDQLRSGNVVLLVDGLDEISDSSKRSQFVAQLRTFVAQYPRVRMVVTSREVGFRVIAGAVGSICNTFRVGELSDESIVLLTLRWHREVLGARFDVEQEANALADSILSTDRVRRLAVNPLLLTTLLLVKRWIGQLPRRRTVLYQKAIEVLLMTWNVEGHEPIDPEEALPQLAFAAYKMMVDGKANVTSSELAALFSEARRSVPEVLAYAKTSVHDFLERVEERSSLLVQSGQRIENGTLRWVYEFKHLTFQEYLCALAIVNGYLPDELKTREPARLLGARVRDPRWREVVALTAVLAGRDAGKILDHLKTLFERIEKRVDSNKERQPRTVRKTQSEMTAILGNIVACLSDEVPITPDAVRDLIDFIIRRTSGSIGIRSLAAGVFGGRYEPILREAIAAGISSEKLPYDRYLYTLSDLIGCSPTEPHQMEVNIAERLNSGAYYDEVEATLMVMLSGYHATRRMRRGSAPKSPNLSQESIRQFSAEIARRLCDGDTDPEPLNFARIWALAWTLPTLTGDVRLVNIVQQKLCSTWRTSWGTPLGDFSSWALRSSPLVGSWQIPEDGVDTDLVAFIQNRQTSPGRTRIYDHLAASFVASYYLKIMDAESLAQSVCTVWRDREANHTLSFAQRMLKALGGVGDRYLKRLPRSQDEAE